MPRVGAIALGALLVASTSGGLCRLGQMHHRADLRQLVGDKPPAGRRLQRNLKLLAAELLAEPPHALPVRWRDPRPRDLTSLGVQPHRGDLRSVLIKAHHERHRCSSLARLARTTPRAAPAGLPPDPDGPAAHGIYQVTPAILGGGGPHRKSRSAP